MAARNFAVKFSPVVQELRLHLCQSSAPSSGVREFMEKSYVSMKKANPSLPILVRECSGVTPKAWARYERGEEAVVALDGLSADQVGESLTKLNRGA